MSEKHVLPPDTLNAIGVLKRREIEARLLIPVVEALGEEFGDEKVHRILRDTIIQIARQQGAQLAENAQAEGNEVDLNAFAETLPAWTKDEAMQFKVLQQDEMYFSFNVTRCRYAEMYRALGIPELGALLSCNRDYSLIEGFNPEIELSRTQTIMEGAEYCDFRYRLREEKRDQTED